MTDYLQRTTMTIKPEMSKTHELIQLLRSLKTAKFVPRSEFLKTICLVDSVLETLFKIEITKTELSTSDRNVIGPLIADLLNAIGAWVSFSVDQIDEAHLEDFKIKRSGLEFLLERYQELPDGKENYLKDAFETFKVTEDIEGWDEQFKNVSSSYDPNVIYTTPDERILNDKETEQLPSSHWWWQY
ncbi:hypothetical protein HNY73_009529 [Argiope bruennichi]|uniref:Uncharacterized protein n=1 Tax=Argiope bruennichi TaxID=94029 RepID=A0A8T0F9X9_ARGBR|nr:hypothetical protein HNY73_009529 [Argiope bruennichi]